MTIDNFCFHLQNRLVQTSQTGRLTVQVIFPLLVFPALAYLVSSPETKKKKFITLTTVIHVIKLFFVSEAPENKVSVVHKWLEIY
jgi:hypothetical protein